MVDYVYRCCRGDEWERRSLLPRGSGCSLLHGVAYGSKRLSPSSFIHASTRLEVAERYWLKSRNEPNAWIARIDMTLIDRYRIFDLSTESGRARYLKGPSKIVRLAKKYAEKDSEVAIQPPVPSEAIQYAVYEGSRVQRWERIAGDIEESHIEKFFIEQGSSAAAVGRPFLDAASYEAPVTTPALELSRDCCFPSSSDVLLNTGQNVKISNLKIGDVVLARSSRTRKMLWSEVYAFGHRDLSVAAVYQVLDLVNGNSISLTPEHLLWALGKGFIPARNVMVGDMLLAGSDDDAELVQVVQIRAQECFGIVAPFTFEGTIVVDNVMASCYASLKHHWLFHVCMSPIRNLYRLCWPLVVAGHMHGGFRLRGAHIYVDLLSYLAPFVKRLGV